MPHKEKLKPVKPTECFIWGSLALVLRVSRFFGLAPLQFTARRHGWRASVSPALHVYSYILALVLNVGIITGVIIDLGLPMERSVRVRTTTAATVWLGELALVLPLISIGILTAAYKMKKLVQIINLLEKVKPNTIPRKDIRSAEFKRYIFAALWMTGCSVIYCGDFSSFLIEAIYEDRELTVISLYSCVSVAMFCVILIQMQFVFVGFHVCSIVADINDALRDHIFVEETQGTSLYSSNTERLATNAIINNKAIDLKVDTMPLTVGDKINRSGTAPKSTVRHTQEALRKLVMSYGTTCDVIERFDKLEGKQMLGLLSLCFLRLVISPYYLVSFFRSLKPRGTSLTFQVLFYIFHTFTLIMIVEPGHRTQRLLEKTERLVSQLQRACHTSDPLTEELDIFYKQIVLNKNVSATCYSPLGVCTMTRPLIATVFGGITTYLVIILQFQTLERQNW